MFTHTTKSIQTGFGKPPEALDAVDMGSASDELILPVINAQVSSIADVNQAVVTPPAIGIDDAIQGDTTPDNPLQGSLSAIRDDFCIHTAIAFEDAEDGRFTEGPTASFAFDAPGTEVRLIQFVLNRERRVGFAIFSNALTYSTQLTINRMAVQTRQGSDLGSIQIKRKQPDNMPKLTLCNSCTECIPVFRIHDSSLASFH